MLRDIVWQHLARILRLILQEVTDTVRHKLLNVMFSNVMLDRLHAVPVSGSAGIPLRGVLFLDLTNRHLHTQGLKARLGARNVKPNCAKAIKLRKINDACPDSPEHLNMTILAMRILHGFVWKVVRLR